MEGGVDLTTGNQKAKVSLSVRQNKTIRFN